MNDKELQERVQKDLRGNPMALVMSMMIDSSLESTHKVIGLVNKYEANNIDVIPISEIKEALNAGHKKVMDDNSLTSSLLKM